MTTFTLQDLNNEYKVTQEEEEAFKQMENIGLKEMFTDMGKDLGVNAFETPVFSSTPPHAPEPQATPNLPDIINNICTQLQLLATVISQPQGNSQPSQAPSGENSLQETIELVLQQSDWFKEMVEKKVADMDFSDQIETQTERYCENYFSYNFDPRDHFDIDEAVVDRVDDKLEGVVADKLAGANISIDFN